MARQAAATASAIGPSGGLLALYLPEVRRARQEIDAQRNAFVRSAANTISFHGTDHLDAATAALFDRRNLPFGQRYAAQLAMQKRMNKDAARNQPIATALGQAGGTVAGVALVAPEYLAAAAIPRLTGAAGLTAREAATLVGAGGATNAAIQVATDAAIGQRPTARRTAAAAVGGSLGAAVLPFAGPARAGAMTGWTTSAAEDVLNGRRISAEAAGQAAIANALLGNIAGVAAAKRVNSLSATEKGRLGEQMGAARSWINGEGRTVGPKKRDYIGDTAIYWYPDRIAGEVRYEDKLGRGVNLRKNQRLAQAALGENFRLNHFVPEDVAAVVGFPVGLTGYSIASGAGFLPENTADVIATNRAKRAQSSEPRSTPGRR